MGYLESPSSFTRIFFDSNPEKHVVLLKVLEQNKATYFSQLKARISESSKKNAFLFVHGYNVTFEDAARRTAQISYDLGFDGAPVFYSWPSEGSNQPLAYTADERDIQWTQKNLQRFLEDFVAQTNAENIYLIAHSMGTRALTKAFVALTKKKPELRSHFQVIILAAPDIDAKIFERDIAPNLIGQTPSITLYTSSEDEALKMSRRIHANEPRLGDANPPFVSPGIETIDATNVRTDFLGHSYFAEARSIIADMFLIMRGCKHINSRFALQPIDNNNGRYWKFR